MTEALGILRPDRLRLVCAGGPKTERLGIDPHGARYSDLA